MSETQTNRSFDAVRSLVPTLAALAITAAAPGAGDPGTALVLHQDVVISNTVLNGIVMLAAQAFPGKDMADRRANIGRGLYHEPNSKSPAIIPITWSGVKAHKHADPAPRATVQVMIEGRRASVDVVPLFVTGLEVSYLKADKGGAIASNGTYLCMLLKPWGTATDEDMEEQVWRAIPLGLLPEVVLREYNAYSNRAGKATVAQIPNRLEWWSRRIEWTPSPPPQKGGRDQVDRSGRLVLGYLHGKRVVLRKGQVWENLPTTGKGSNKVFTAGVFSVVETATFIEVAYLGLPKETPLIPERAADLASPEFPVDPWRVFGWTPSTADRGKIEETVARLLRQIEQSEHPTVAYCCALGLIPPNASVANYRALIEQVLRKGAEAMIEELDAVWERISSAIDRNVMTFELEPLVGANTVRAAEVAKHGWRGGSLDRTAAKLKELFGECDPKAPMHRKACMYLLDRLAALIPPAEAPAAPAPEAVEGTDTNPSGNAAAPGDGADTSTSTPSGEDSTTPAA